MKTNNEFTRSVRIINTINKVLYIISIVVLVISAIGFISGLAGAIGLLNNKDTLVDGEYLWFKIFQESSERGRGTNIYTVALYVLDGAIYSFGMLVISYFAFRYFKTNLNNKTVFTRQSGSGIFKLGLINIITGFAIMILCVIMYTIFINVFKNDYRLLSTKISYVGFGWTGLGIGLVFLVISLFINAYNENISNKKTNK